MMTGYNLFIPFIITLIITFLLTKYPIALSSPSSRGLHTKDIPTSGGIAIFFGFISIFYFSDYDSLSFFLIFIFTVTMGLLDDIFSLSKIIRFVLQAIISLFIIYHFAGYSSMHPIFILLILLGIIFLINMVNFMDGIDSIIILQFVFFFLSIILLTSTYSSLPYLLTLIAFLFFNRPKASIFLGSSGSYLLGVLLACIFIDNLYFVFLYAILMTPFIVDSVTTLVMRFVIFFRNDRNLMKSLRHVTSPHCTHMYQHITKEYNSHTKCLFIIMSYNIFWCLPISYLYYNSSNMYTDTDYYVSFSYLLLSYVPYFILCIKKNAGIVNDK